MIRLYFFSVVLIFLMGVGPLPLQAKETAKKQAAKPQPPAPRVIVIDAGHGGKDPGTLTRRTKEKDITLAMAKRLGKVVQKRMSTNLVPVKVAYTRSTDRFITLEERDRIANRNSCDFFVSIHVNSASSKRAEGIEIYYLNNATDKAAARLAARENRGATAKESDVQAILSGLIQNASTEDAAETAGYMKKGMLARLKSKFGTKGVGIRTAVFYVLVGAKCPSLLVETGFITNLDEEKRLKRPAYQNALADAIVDGIEAYFHNLDSPRSDL